MAEKTDIEKRMEDLAKRSRKQDEQVATFVRWFENPFAAFIALLKTVWKRGDSRCPDSNN